LLHEHLEQDIRIDSAHPASSSSSVVVMAVAVIVTVSSVRIVQVLQLNSLVIPTKHSTELNKRDVRKRHLL